MSRIIVAKLSTYDQFVFVENISVQQGSTLRIFSTGPVGPVVQIFTGPDTKKIIVAVIIVFDLYYNK